MALESEHPSALGRLPTWEEPRLLPILAGAVATAPFTWWVLGMMTHFSDAASPDYLVQPLDMSEGTELLIGLSAMVLASAGGFLIAWSIRSHRWSIRWAGVLGPVFAAFGYAGATYRVITAPVTGANIGGGILILAAGPVALVLLGLLIVFARHPRAVSSSAHPGLGDARDA